MKQLLNRHIMDNADGLSIPRLWGNLLQPKEDDPFTPHEPPFIWYAMGDSYTAGPGAGELWDPGADKKCVRSAGSYAPQLESDWLYNGEEKMNFIACTGARTYNVIEDQLQKIDSDPAPDLVVMTIGGNDVGFSKIAKACLIGLWGSGDCDEKIAEAMSIVQSAEFYNRLSKVYDGIFDQMPNDGHYQVLHLGYSRFFNVDDESTWCNGQTFGKFGLGSRPKLTLELRKKLNNLTKFLNTHLFIWSIKYASDRLHDKRDPWEVQRLFFGDYDAFDEYSFSGHRFCEVGVEDPKFGDPETWIFGVWGDQNDAEVSADYFAELDAGSCGSDARYESDDAFAWDCDMAVHYADDTTDRNVTTIPGFDFTRPFHPKTRGFEKVKDFIVYQMHKRRRSSHIKCIPFPENEEALQLLAGKDITLCPPEQSSPPPTETTTSDTSPSTTTSHPPTGTCKSMCHCDESKCSDDSPGCCPNGTCDDGC
ncbi:hypothetical protein FQN54_002266 [Arachnomyces sp. PD_36]|nr:hypothetical protein FQN54_002266 [Arachnomyces sp. PD_36]